MTLPNPLRVYDELRDAYMRYVDTAFYLRSGELMEERRDRLLSGELLFTDVLLEPVLPYDSTDELLGAAGAAGLSKHSAGLVGEALFGEFTEEGQPIMLRQHQADALRQSLQHGSAAGRNVVVTSGTGSGKTESFLLPVLSRIVEESLSWPNDGSSVDWWNNPNQPWESSRSQCARQSAVRALILYPTNALVEDQITRLRRAVRSLQASGGKQLWFGRYTGATLGSGEPPVGRRDRRKVQSAARYVAETVREFEALQRSNEGLPLEEQIDLSQFADGACQPL